MVQTWDIRWLLFALSLTYLVASTSVCVSDGYEPTRSLFVALQEESSIPAGYDASQPDSAPEFSKGALGFSHYVFEQIDSDVMATLIEGPRGKQVRSDLSYSALKTIYLQNSRIPNNLAMSRKTLGDLIDQIDELRRATFDYRYDIRLALTHGYVVTGGEVANMGLHLASPARIRDGIFDPSRPEMLLYARTEENTWELVGAAFVLPTQLVGYTHPDGFAGDLDNWHVHYSLCTTDSATYSASEKDCEMDGGDWTFSFGWMIHAYVWKSNPLGVFNMWNPNVPPKAPIDSIETSRADGFPASAQTTLFIEDFGFQQGRAQAGSNVVWTNADAVFHSINTSRKGEGKLLGISGTIAPGESYTWNLPKPGEYQLTCDFHPTMTGTLIITE